MGVIKSFVIGAFVLVAVYLGSFTFIGNGMSAYNVPSNSSVMLSRTMGYLTILNQTSSGYQSLITESGSMNINVLTYLGLVFNNLGNFVISLFTIGGLLISIFTGLEASAALFSIPPQVATIIGSMVTAVIALAGIAILIGRGTEDI